MEALISGRNGLALVVDGDRLASIHVDEPDQMIPRHPGEIHFLTGERSDFFPVEGVSRSEIVRQLTLAHNRERCLTLTLILIDPDISDGLRLKVAKTVGDLIGEEQVLVFLESVLYAEPLPAQADLHGGLRLARQAGATRVQILLELFWNRQNAIAAVREAWDAIPSLPFDGEHKRWQSVAVREGLFRKLVLTYEAGRSFNEFLLEARKVPAVRSLPNYRVVLKHWVSPLAQFTEKEGLGRLPELQPGVVAEPVGEYGHSTALDPATTEALQKTSSAVFEAMRAALSDLSDRDRDLVCQLYSLEKLFPPRRPKVVFKNEMMRRKATYRARQRFASLVEAAIDEAIKNSDDEAANDLKRAKRLISGGLFGDNLETVLKYVAS